MEAEAGLEQLGRGLHGLVEVLIVQALSLVPLALPGSLLHGVLLLDDGRARLATKGVGHIGERRIHLNTLLVAKIIGLIF